MATYKKLDDGTVQESVTTKRVLDAEMLTMELEMAKSEVETAQARYDAVKAKVAKVKQVAPSMAVSIPVTK